MRRKWVGLPLVVASNLLWVYNALYIEPTKEEAMRSFIRVLLLVAALLLLPQGATGLFAEETRFGYYGYRHGELHALGIIDELMRKTGTNCCDGGMGGECRVSQIRWNGEVWEAYADGEWFPVRNTPVHFSIEFPRTMPAIVCASKGKYDDGSRSIYCVAGRFET